MKNFDQLATIECVASGFDMSPENDDERSR